MGSQHVEGLSELLESFKGLPVELQNNANKAATSDAAAVFRDEAKALAPIMSEFEPKHAPPGTLRNAIQIARIRGGSPTRAQYAVFVRQGAKYMAVKVRVKMAGPLLPGERRRSVSTVQNQDAYYWRFVEFGTTHAKRQSFMRPAFDASVDKAIDAYTDKFRERYEAAVKKFVKGKL